MKTKGVRRTAPPLGSEAAGTIYEGRPRGRRPRGTPRTTVRVQLSVSSTLLDRLNAVRDNLGASSQADVLSQMLRFAAWYLRKKEDGYTLVARYKRTTGPTATAPMSPDTASGPVRLQIDVDEKTHALLVEVKHRLSLSSQLSVLRQLIAFAEWYVEVVAVGATFLLESTNAKASGREVEVVFL